MKFSPKDARRVAFQILYGFDAKDQRPLDAQDLEETLQEHLNHFEVPRENRPFVCELVQGTLRDHERLDQTLEKASKNWKLDRMSSVDRTVLRMAIYEMTQHHTDSVGVSEGSGKIMTPQPRAIVINEAVELAKEFGDQKSPSFINGILDGIPTP